MTPDFRDMLPKGALPKPPRTIAPAEPVTSIRGASNAPELCHLVDAYRPELFPAGRGCVEVKLDGLRCLHVGNGRLVSREGSQFEAASHCAPMLRKLEGMLGGPHFFDGEYCVDGGLEAAIASFRSRSTVGGLWLFDAVPLDQWQSGLASSDDYLARKTKLRRACERAGMLAGPVGSVGYVEAISATDPDQVERYAQELWRQGYEGLIVKDAGSRYVRKRSCDWMKVKLSTVSDMIVVDVLPSADGKTARAVLVRLPGQPPARPVKVPVHGAIAAAVWAANPAIVGTALKIRHAGFTGGGQPREARVDTREINV